MNLKTNTKIYSLIVFAVVVSLFLSFQNVSGQGIETTGWGWGGSTDDNLNFGISSFETGGLGWISFNSLNLNTNPSYSLVTPQGGGSNKPVTGYAWSNNVGWIDFNPASPYPEAPYHSAERESIPGTHDKLTGWARILSIESALTAKPSNSGGWEGWIKLSSDSADSISYGVTIEKNSGTLDDYAWSNEFGWIDFDGSVGPYTPGNTPTVTISAPDATAAEPDDEATIRFTRTSAGGLGSDLVVNFSVPNSGTATEGVDYNSIGTTAIIPINETDIEVKIKPIDDLIVEGTETIDISINPNSAYSIGAIGNITASLLDNDGPPAGSNPVISCSGSPNPSYIQDGGNVTWTITILTPGAVPHTYDWFFTDQFNLPATASPSPPQTALLPDPLKETITTVYDSTGTKGLQVTVTDSDGNSDIRACSPVEVENKPFNIIEILPF